MARPRKDKDLTSQETTNLETFELPKESEPQSDDLEVKLTKLEAAQSEELIPGFCEPEWHDYVMKHFQEDELFKGLPTADGMRRVTELLIGRIVESQARSIQWPGLMPDGRLTPATVEYTIKIIDKTSANQLVFTEISDAYVGNTVKEFAMHPSAMAATRAEGRALRKALKLRKIVSAEEAASPSIEESELNGKINNTQINFINVLCNNNNIDVMKYVNSGSKQYSNITDVPFDKAVEMVAFLSKLQTEHTKIPENIKGYDPEWQKKNHVSF